MMNPSLYKKKAFCRTTELKRSLPVWGDNPYASLQKLKSNLQTFSRSRENMVFLTFPNALTEEEEMLKQKYARLRKKVCTYICCLLVYIPQFWCNQPQKIHEARMLQQHPDSQTKALWSYNKLQPILMFIWFRFNSLLCMHLSYYSQLSFVILHKEFRNVCMLLITT